MTEFAKACSSAPRIMVDVGRRTRAPRNTVIQARIPDARPRVRRRVPDLQIAAAVRTARPGPAVSSRDHVGCNTSGSDIARCSDETLVKQRKYPTEFSVEVCTVCSTAARVCVKDRRNLCVLI
jgi:hypothetical protein